jgi:hypothetical protein
VCRHAWHLEADTAIAQPNQAWQLGLAQPQPATCKQGAAATGASQVYMHQHLRSITLAADAQHAETLVMDEAC